MNEQASIFAPARDAGQAEPPRETDLIRLGAILAAIGRGWWIVLIATAACLALAYHYAFNVATPTYRAAASIVLETGERAFISFDESTGQLSRDTPSLNTQIGVLRGIDLMGRVVDVMALDRDPEFNPIPAVPAGGQSDAREAQLAREIALRNLLGAVEVRNLPESLIFEISVTTSDPVKSMTIANTIVETYIAEQVDRKIAESRRAADWLRNRVSELQAELLEVQTRVDDFRFGPNGATTDTIVRRERLVSEAEAIRTLHRYLLTRLQETIAQEGLHRPDSRILSSAMLPLHPAAPRQTRILVVGGAVGLFLGLVGVFLREAARKGIRSIRMFSRVTRLPVLGAFPRVPFSQRRSEMRGLVGPRAAHFTEAVETLLTRLMISRVGEAPHVFAVVSPHSGDGKTSAVLSMARQFAARGFRTLVIDADTRKRTLSVNAGFSSPGLTAALAGEPLQGAVAQNPVLRCDVLGLPARVGEADAMPDVAAVLRLLEAARFAYDITIIDTPPLNAVADALPFAAEADSVLLMARWNGTSAADLDAALETLAQIGATPCGVVVTQVKPSVLGQAGYASYFKRV